MPAGSSLRTAAVIGFQLFVLSVSQDPAGTWRPNQHTSLGLTCAKDAPNPNDPASSHGGGCGCENTLLRLDGQLYLMESHSHVQCLRHYLGTFGVF